MEPKIIHQITGIKRSSLVNFCMNSWIPLKGFGYKVAYWSNEGIERFIRQKYNFAYEAYVNARNHAEAADIARYLIIHHFGGSYVDVDIHLNDIKKFIDLNVQYCNGYFVIDPTNSTIASEHFSSVIGNKYLLEIVKDISKIYEDDLRENFATPQYSGPYRMKDTLTKFNDISYSFIPVKNIFEYSYSEIRQAKEFCKESIMIHFWEHSWINS